MINELVLGDSSVELESFQDKTIDFCVIDPPYGISHMNADWDLEKIKKSISESEKKSCVVKKIPVGMKFDPQDAKNLNTFLKPISKQILRLLKPGAFCVVFSQPRSSHQVAMAFEDAGFEIRDQLIWDYGAGHGKAQSVANFIKKNSSFSEQEKKHLIENMKHLKTPQLTPTFETMWLCQKPKEGTFVENYIKYGVGLVDFSHGLRRVKFEHRKPSKEERRDSGDHPTVKPLSLIEDVINTFSPKGSLVLDCFLGSGTTAVACLRTGRNFLGIEKEKEYFEISKKRIDNETNRKK